MQFLRNERAFPFDFGQLDYQFNRLYDEIHVEIDNNVRRGHKKEKIQRKWGQAHKIDHQHKGKIILKGKSCVFWV